jgi:hypothetical protein
MSDYGSEEAVQHFREICTAAGWVPEAIAESVHESADFLVTAEGGRFVAEVKQINPNTDEMAKETEARAGKVIVALSEPGDRLRPLIKKANSQIKAVAPPNTPGLLVVYDSRWGSRVEPYDALTAMYGLQAVVINVPLDPGVEPSWGGERFAGQRGVSPGYNRSVSALAIISQQPRPAMIAYVFHNDYARVKFDPSLFRVPSFQQFRRADHRPGDFAGWEQI